MIYLIVISIYFLLAVFVMVGFISHPYDQRTSADLLPVSIVIVARNEQEYIEECLSAIASQNFPKELIEIIVVDDHSSDTTAVKAKALLETLGMKHQLIGNQTHLGKKESIKKAIAQCSNEFIITRDADTFTRSNEWLSGIVNYYSSSKKEFIICPIAIDHKQTALSSLQEMETAVLSLFTISSAFYKAPFLCSGANLAFTKNIFYKTKAYESHLHIPSGDDVFFLEEVKKVDANCIAYLKSRDVVVYTYPEKDIKSLIQQKIRWSAKVFKSGSVFNWLTAVIMAISNFLWLWALFYVLFGQQNQLISLIFVLAKLLIDILLVFLASSFIKIKTRGAMALLIGCFYPVYASVVVVLATLMKPKWKSN